MVICPIARAVHCTGCLLLKICPLKTILGDYKNNDADAADTEVEREEQTAAKNPGDSSAGSR